MGIIASASASSKSALFADLTGHSLRNLMQFLLFRPEVDVNVRFIRTSLQSLVIIKSLDTPSAVEILDAPLVQIVCLPLALIS